MANGPKVSGMSLSVGSSTHPVTAIGSHNFGRSYYRHAGTSGDVRALYADLDFISTGSGETLRLRGIANGTNVATGGTVNAAHLTGRVAAAKTVSGALNALRCTLEVAGTTPTPGGTIASLQLDSNIVTGATLGSGAAATSFVRVTNSGATAIPYFLNMAGISDGAGTMLDGGTLKCRGPAGDLFLLLSSSAQTLTISRSTTENQKVVDITSSPTDVTHGVRQGALYISVNRAAGYPTAGSWDGNPDCGLKIQASNRAANAVGLNVRGFDVNARNRDSGVATAVNGGYITAENSTGTGGVTDVVGLEVHSKNNAVASGNVMGLRVYDESQSGTGTNYAVSIDCTNDSAFTREFCVHINSGASSGWTNGLTFDGNVTNALDFVDSDGTNSATYSAGHYATLGAIDGKIKVDIGGNTLYLPCYVSIAA